MAISNCKQTLAKKTNQLPGKMKDVFGRLIPILVQNENFNLPTNRHTFVSKVGGD